MKSKPNGFAKLWIAALAISSALALTAPGARAHAAGAAAFPYVAYVIEPDTYIRSGPGQQHYPTGQLPAGFAVEVFRHDGEGWCAIRPPAGSFSLAPAHQIRIIDSRTAEVAADGVVARVGSGVAAHRNAVQVLLERGEAIELVEKPVPGEPWVKIAPPAGEFRWIAARRLSRMPPMESSQGAQANSRWQSQPSSAPEQPSNGADAFGHLQALPSGSPTTAPAPPDEGNQRWQPEPSPGHAITHGDVAVQHGADEIEVVEGSPAQVLLAHHQQPADQSATTSAGQAASTSGQPRIRFRGQAAGPTDARVAELELRLSQAVLQPPGSWQLASIREETASLLAQEPSQLIREQLRDVLDRIATFETVQNRYRGVAPATQWVATAGSVSPTSPATGAVAAPSATVATGATSDVLARVRTDLGVDRPITPTPVGAADPAGQTAAAEPLYDAVGTLKPVVSRHEQAPRYALIDDHGDVVTFVTATADVNLQPFVGKRIGVRGSRGYMPEFRRAHVTASRITPLEQTLVK